MITQRFLERDGDRLLLRIAVNEVAVLDILTDAASMAAGREAIHRAATGSFVEQRLGSFGPLDVTLSITQVSNVAIAVDGPDVGEAFQGNQSVVFYFDRDEILDALRAE